MKTESLIKTRNRYSWLVQLILLLVSCFLLIYFFPNGILQFCSLVFAFVLFIWGVCKSYFLYKGGKVLKAILYSLFNVTILTSTAIMEIHIDEIINCKVTCLPIIDKKIYDDFKVTLGEYKQINTPIIDGVRIKSDMFVTYRSWYVKINDKSKICVHPKVFDFIIEMKGMQQTELFYWLNKKYDILDRETHLYSIKKDVDKDILYTMGQTYNMKKLNGFSLPDTMVIYIVKYNNPDVIQDSLVYTKTTDIKTTDAVIFGGRDIELYRKRSIVDRIKDIFFIEESKNYYK